MIKWELLLLFEFLDIIHKRMVHFVINRVSHALLRPGTRMVNPLTPRRSTCATPTWTASSSSAQQRESTPASMSWCYKSRTWRTEPPLKSGLSVRYEREYARLFCWPIVRKIKNTSTPSRKTGTSSKSEGDRRVGLQRSTGVGTPHRWWQLWDYRVYHSESRHED